MHFAPILGQISHPGWQGGAQKLSYCNGEIGAGSSNITLYMVWPYERPRWVAQTLQQMRILRVESEKEVGEPREHHKANAGNATLQQENKFFTAPMSQFPDAFHITG
jgi:hypothetical protein